METLEQGVKYTERHQNGDANATPMAYIFQTPERRQWPKYFLPCSSVSIVNFEQVNAGWDLTQVTLLFSLGQIYISLWHNAIPEQKIFLDLITCLHDLVMLITCKG